jgi:Protein of unknown function (DUF2911)
MKRFRNLSVAFCAFALLGAGPVVSLAHGNERGETTATVGGARVSIHYAQPALKGRDPMKMIEPGKVWRMGADIPTTIESDKDLLFGQTRVPKGTHILLAQLVAPGQWILIVSSKPFNQYEPSAKIAAVPMKEESGRDPVEMMAIKLSAKGNRGTVEVVWGGSRLLAAFTAAP